MMKFNWGKIPQNPDFDPVAQGWIAIKEPSPWLSQLMGLPFGVLAAVLLGIAWVYFTPMEVLVGNMGFSFIGWVLGFVALHELAHAALHPGNGASSDSILGFWPSKLLFYAHYDGVLSKQRLLIIVIGPFIVLSFVPLVICSALQHASNAMFALSVLNSLIASVDLIFFLLIIIQVPSGATLQNNGWKTYYRMADSS